VAVLVDHLPLEPLHKVKVLTVAPLVAEVVLEVLIRLAEVEHQDKVTMVVRET
jgi:hypothetical protein